MTAAGAELDGRRLRREQNRGAVLDALVELFGEGSYHPSVGQIAERAGLSPRSLFRYFDDVDDLSRAAIESQLAAARPLLRLGVGPDAPTTTKIRGLVDARTQLFETSGPAARAARSCAPRNLVVAAQLRQSRAYLRRQVERLFARELDRSGAELLPATDALCSFETYELLRVDQRLSQARAKSALVTALQALLAPTGGTP